MTASATRRPILVAMLLAITGACAACSFKGSPPAGGDGAPGDAADGPMLPDAPIDAAPGTDPDGDGVLSEDDNCQFVSNVDQHDEDGDLAGDACDACPQDTRAQADTDADGIGDDCDPNPGSAGDVLAQFYGFGAPGGLPPGWGSVTGVDGDWQVTNDALAVALVDSVHIIRFDPAAAHVRIDLAVDLSAQGAMTPHVSALFALDASAADYMLCTVFTGAPERRMQHFTTAGSFQTLGSDTSDPPGLGIHRIIATLGTGSTCEFSGTTSHVLTAPPAASSQTGVGIRLRSEAAAIRYIAIYTSP